MVMSAVSSVRTPGVLVTRIARLRAVSRSILSTPVPNWAISLSSGPAWLSTARSIRSVTVGTSTLAVLHGCDQFVPRKGLVVEVEPRVEQLPQPRFHDIRQFTRDDNERSFRSHNYVPSEGWAVPSPSFR